MSKYPFKGFCEIVQNRLALDDAPLSSTSMRIPKIFLLIVLILHPKEVCDETWIMFHSGRHCSLAPGMLGFGKQRDILQNKRTITHWLRVGSIEGQNKKWIQVRNVTITVETCLVVLTASLSSMIDTPLTQYMKVLIAPTQLWFYIILLRKFLFCHS